MYVGNFMLFNTDKVLSSMVTDLARMHNNEHPAREFIIEQIKERDYAGAATTIALSFPQFNEPYDDLPKVLMELSNSLSYDHSSMLSTLREILADISVEKDDIMLETETCYKLGHQSSICYLQAVMAHVLERWRKRKKTLTAQTIARILGKGAGLAHTPDFCPNFACVVNCYSYAHYFPFYSKWPINNEFCSLYGLAEEFIEFYRTGTPHVLLELSQGSAYSSDMIRQQAQSTLDQYASFLRILIGAIGLHDATICFF